MIIVSDTTPLSELAKINKLSLLQDIFGTVFIPEEVYSEATSGTHPAVETVKSATWIQVQSVKNSRKVFQLMEDTALHLGECAAIILAEELGADQILIDEVKARQVAKTRNLSVLGTLGTLLIAKEQSLILSVKDIVDALIANGTWISRSVYDEILVVAKEKPFI